MIQLLYCHRPFLQIPHWLVLPSQLVSGSAATNRYFLLFLIRVDCNSNFIMIFFWHQSWELLLVMNRNTVISFVFKRWFFMSLYSIHLLSSILIRLKSWLQHLIFLSIIRAETTNWRCTLLLLLLVNFILNSITNGHRWLHSLLFLPSARWERLIKIHIDILAWWIGWPLGEKFFFFFLNLN